MSPGPDAQNLDGSTGCAAYDTRLPLSRPERLLATSLRAGSLTSPAPGQTLTSLSEVARSITLGHGLRGLYRRLVGAAADDVGGMGAGTSADRSSHWMRLDKLSLTNNIHPPLEDATAHRSAARAALDHRCRHDRSPTVPQVGAVG